MGKIRITSKARLVLWSMIAVSIALYFLGKEIPEQTIQRLVQGTGSWAPVFFILLHSISIIIAPISGLPFLVAGFYLFGETTIIYMYFSAVVGFVVNFYIAKRWGRSLVVRLIGRESIDKVDKLAREYGVITLLFLRLLWGGIADYVSYAYGLTSMKFKTYILISTIASIPSWVFWYYVASQILSVEQFLLVTYILTFLGAGTFLLGRFLVKKRF